MQTASGTRFLNGESSTLLALVPARSPAKLGAGAGPAKAAGISGGSGRGIAISAQSTALGWIVEMVSKRRPSVFPRLKSAGLVTISTNLLSVRSSGSCGARLFIVVGSNVAMCCMGILAVSIRALAIDISLKIQRGLTRFCVYCRFYD